MVVKETQRAFVYFSLHGLTCDEVVVNRVLPDAVSDPYFDEWRASQRQFLGEVEAYFSPVPVRRVPLFPHEVVGLDRIEELSRVLYPEGMDPAGIRVRERPFTFAKTGERYEVRLRAPFTGKSEVGLFKKGDELVVEIGTIRRHIGLPTSMATLTPSRARLEEGMLVVEMKEAS
jgi:arsenite-transporting ATPase